jgi:hypothetical protein
MLRGMLLALALALLVAQDTPAQQQCPDIPFNVLVPFSWPCPILPRMCRTDYGVCRVGVGVAPGTPCSCQAANGVWYPGVCIR